MNKKAISLFLCLTLVISSALSLCSCGGKAEYPVTVGSVTLNSEPENIVILSKSLADVISCIGYDTKMVGRSTDITEKGLQVVPTVGTAHDPDATLIEEVGGQIVFADSTISEGAAKELEDKGIPVVIIKDAQTPKQLKSMYKKIGSLLGGNITGKAKAKAAAEDLLGTLNEIKSAVAAESIIKTMCYLYIDNGVLKTMNNGTWGSQMLNYTGAVNVFKNSDSNIVDSEVLCRVDPDYIFCADEDVKTYLQTSSVYGNLDALSENTFIVSYDEINMQGLKALDVIETMIRNIFPEQFHE